MENVKINIIIKNKGNLLANATISIETLGFGFVTLKNFQIWRSKNYNARLQADVNIKPTSLYSHGRYYDQVFFEDNQKWFALETLIYQAYSDKVNNNQEVNPDDVPF